MSPPHFQFNNQNAKRESNPFSPSSTSSKINKDSHLIKKSSSSSSSFRNGVACVANKSSQPRHPVIIYTHSPKVIHTNPHDFMALVQKLTGLSSPSEEDQSISLCQQQQQQPKSETNNYHEDNNKNGNRGLISDDNESTSRGTDENNSSLSDPQVNSCYVPSPIFDPPNPCFSINGIPFFNPNSTDFLSSQPFCNYPESFYYMPKMRSSFSSSSIEGMRGFPDF